MSSQVWTHDAEVAPGSDSAAGGGLQYAAPMDVDTLVSAGERLEFHDCDDCITFIGGIWRQGTLPSLKNKQ